MEHFSPWFVSASLLRTSVWVCLFVEMLVWTVADPSMVVVVAGAGIARSGWWVGGWKAGWEQLSSCSRARPRITFATWLLRLLGGHTHTQPHQLLFHPPRLKSPYSFSSRLKTKKKRRPDFSYVCNVLHYSMGIYINMYFFSPSYSYLLKSQPFFYFLSTWRLLCDAVASLLNRFKLLLIIFPPTHFLSPTSWSQWGWREEK
jgi:hypothetical protein